jgi:acyl-CoA synthetase (AMP-forming)/AMP-acid ligase II
MLCVLAILHAGVVWVPINARNTLEDNAAVMDRADCSILIVHSEFAEKCLGNAGLFPKLEMLITTDREMQGAIYLGALLDEDEDPIPRPIADDPQRISAILSTSGTTGVPKGVVWTEQVWETMIANFWIHLPCDVRPVYLLAAPMTHAAGVLAFPLFAAGATIVILPRPDPKAIIDAIATHGVTHLFLPPTAIYALLDHPDVGSIDYATLKYFIYTAAPMAVEKLKRAIEVFGPVMTQLYGQAEVPAMGTFLGPAEHVEALSRDDDDRLWSCGRPCMLTGVDVVKEDGQPTQPFELGEIVFRGNLVSPFYYRDPEATAEVKRDGWHHSGDLGHRDHDGFIYIVDRKKDMIVSGGFNVYSSEVEKIILSHPAIRECAVIGVPDDKWGEAVKAIVELNANARVDTTEIMALCRARLGSVKTPKSVEIWDMLPRNSNGKVLKREVREGFWRGRRRAV